MLKHNLLALFQQLRQLALALGQFGLPLPRVEPGELLVNVALIGIDLRGALERLDGARLVALGGLAEPE